MCGWRSFSGAGSAEEKRGFLHGRAVFVGGFGPHRELGVRFLVQWLARSAVEERARHLFVKDRCRIDPRGTRGLADSVEGYRRQDTGDGELLRGFFLSPVSCTLQPNNACASPSAEAHGSDKGGPGTPGADLPAFRTNSCSGTTDAKGAIP